MDTFGYWCLDADSKALRDLHRHPKPVQPSLYLQKEPLARCRAVLLCMCTYHCCNLISVVNTHGMGLCDGSASWHNGQTGLSSLFVCVRDRSAKELRGRLTECMFGWLKFTLYSLLHFSCSHLNTQLSGWRKPWIRGWRMWFCVVWVKHSGHCISGP